MLNIKQQLSNMIKFCKPVMLTSDRVFNLDEYTFICTRKEHDSITLLTCFHSLTVQADNVSIYQHTMKVNTTK